MPLVRSQINVTPAQGDVPKDIITNTVYHDIGDSGFDPSVDYANHATEVCKLFTGRDPTHGSFTEYDRKYVTVKVYDMADAKPRPVKSEAVWTPATYDLRADLGPRQISLVLAFFASRNLPRTRGRIYIGGIVHTSSNAERPSTTLMTDILDLGHGLFDIGGENVSHRVWSPTGQLSHVVTDYWVNDVWDTQRSRLQKESQRVQVHP